MSTPVSRTASTSLWTSGAAASNAKWCARRSSIQKLDSARLYNRLMTSDVLEFTVSRTANPASDDARQAILADPGFGKYFTDHMVSIDYADGQGWHNARVIPYGPIELDPSAIVLHYAQEVFEGLKAYRWADGSIVSFRRDANAARMRASARRLAIPELPDEIFLESLRQLAAVDNAWVPAAGGEEALYFRPF